MRHVNSEPTAGDRTSHQSAALATNLRADRVNRTAVRPTSRVVAVGTSDMSDDPVPAHCGIRMLLVVRDTPVELCAQLRVDRKA
ncbi:MAG: hypothetical protein Q8K82_03495 [Gemmatimonadaceae bacterium]|nr:hypothetical protein [Gemmatimonadaceae bacterium]